MNRLALAVARGGAHMPPISTTAPISRAIPAAATVLPTLIPRTYATSAPKSAEGPSAESGGSRSKDAVVEEEEAAAAADTANENAGSTPTEQQQEPVLGRTGGGEPLETSQNPPPKPKVFNSAVHPMGKTSKLSQEQLEEVERHNKDFEQRYDRAGSAEEDKVDKRFWSEEGGKDGK